MSERSAEKMLTTSVPEFSEISAQFNATLTKANRQEAGIFFTPQTARSKLWEALDRVAPRFKPKRILEPSAGSGEFIADCLRRYPRIRPHGVEQNPALTAAAQAAYPLALIHSQDFLEYQQEERFDLIVGNPPYFQTKAKDTRCMTGRGNIFVQFIYKSLAWHLAPGGILAFVLPTSFYNCAYYEPCRKYIAANHTLLHVETLGATPWFETAQDTMIMIVRAGPCASPKPFIFTPAGTELVYISPHAEELKALTKDAYTFAALGFDVKTGGIVWSEHKHGNSKKSREFELSDDPEDELLIYSGNIKDGSIELFAAGEQRNGKKQYIRNAGTEPLQGPAFLVARGYGNTSYKLDYGFVPEGTAFHAENHLNVISANGPLPTGLAEAICVSLESEETKKFLKMFVGNGALSASELLHVFPVWPVVV
jgi:hypothetical protein